MNQKNIVRAGYDKVSYVYRGDTIDPDRDLYYRECMASLLAHVALGSRILDLGCGCRIPAVQQLSLQHRVAGVDLSTVQIERARHLVPRADFIRADMTEIDFPSQAPSRSPSPP